MAVTETVKILFEADTKAITDTTEDLVKLKKITQEEADALKKLGEEAKKTDTAIGGLGDELDHLGGSLPKVNDNVDNVNQSFVSLRTQVKQAKEEVQRAEAAFGAFSNEANDARVKAGQLVDKLGDMNRQLNLLNPEAKAKAFVNFGNNIVGAFQIATGALQAFGAENEQVQKIAMKLQGALNVAQGISSLKSLKESYQDIKVVLGVTTAAQTTLNTTQTAGAVTTGGLTKAFQALRIAMVSNPFTAIAVAIGAVIGAMMLLADNTEEAVSATEQLKNAQDGLLNTSKSLTKSELDLAVATGKISKARADIILQREEESKLVKPLIDDQKKLNEEIQKQTKELQALRDAGLSEDTFGDNRVNLAKENLDKLRQAEQANEQAIENIRREGRNRRKLIEIEEAKSATKNVQEALKKIDVKKVEARFENIDVRLEPKTLDDAVQQLGEQISTALDDINVKPTQVPGGDWLNDFFDKEDKLREQKIKNIQQTIDLSQEAFQIFADSIQNQYAEEADSLAESRERGLITEEQYQTKLKAIKRKAAEDQKKAQIFQATLNAAQGVLSASAGFYLTPVERTTAIAFAIATGALNLAKIIATPLPKFKKGTLAVPGIDTGQDSVMAMLRPGEAVIPTETNREYAPVIRAIYRRDINAKELNDFVTNREQSAFAFNQVSLDALYKRDLKVSAITGAGRTAQANVQPTRITADVDVQQLSKAMSKNKGVEVTNPTSIARALAQELSKTNNIRRQ